MLSINERKKIFFGYTILFAALVIFLSGTIVFSHEKPLSDSPTPSSLGFEEHLGTYVPLDISFVTETGMTVLLGDLIKEPTVLSITYYRCSNACNLQLTSIATALKKYSAAPGAEPNILSVTINSSETIADAQQTKKIVYSVMDQKYPIHKWHFLTGTDESIKKLTDAVGFRYAKKGNDFDHPLGIIILSPQGKIVRYILGSQYLPMDLKISLMEAAQGTVGPTIARVLRFCFSYNPESHSFVFNTLRVSAVVIFTIVAGFMLYLIISGRSRRRQGGA